MTTELKVLARSLLNCEPQWNDTDRLLAERLLTEMEAKEQPKKAILEAEESLYAFLKQAWPEVESQPFIDNWHIGMVAEHLQAVTEGQIQNLLVNIPPGCSKSLITSVFWPMWEWIRNPSARWFFASYDQRLSTRDSVKCRNLLTSAWYQKRWGELFKLRDDQNQKTYYETDKGGYRLATSVGGHGTGEHPDRIVVDDPHDAKGAESPAERQSVLEWWDQTMTTRGASRGSRRVIIMQRLNTADLSGHVLESGEYVHVNLAMRYESGTMKPTVLADDPKKARWANDPRQTEGELLTPTQFPEAVVAKMEKAMGPYGTAGQFQQRPVPRGGGIFKKEDLSRIVNAVPANVVRAWYWDKGYSAKGDFTAGVLMAKTGEGVYYIEDVVRGRWDPNDRNRIIKAAMDAANAKYRRQIRAYIEQPPGAGAEAVGTLIRQLAGHAVQADLVHGKKEERAEPLADQCAAGNVYLVRGEWNRDFVAECVVFPNGANDDQVDAASGAFLKLAKPPTGGYSAGGERKPMQPSVGAIREMGMPGGFM